MNKVTFDRGEMNERIVDIYVSADTLRDGETSTKREETADTAPNNGPGDQHSERDQLQTRYNNLTEERDQLQTKYNNLTEERDQLQTRYNNLTTERDRLQNLLCERTCCSDGWKKFECSCYFISSEEKTWEKSRQDCLERGTDLVIINSKEEQEFLFHFKKRVWIGLTDRETEETWKWVDGTPLTTEYWYDPQPDNAGSTGEEDCVEIHKDQSPLTAWNDLSCDCKLNWICEKVA
ncbi:C-type lectin domain family 4 member E-like isoform X3 [Oncorhynchus masou masou]|uniref:C-type lectin domain family 4 member E-like isoform X3 n=1 Tax=Oncorhynchus masou masou TaxID=90313 RepID=UPI003182F28B